MEDKTGEEGSLPRVPPPTYQWETIRKQKEEGQYPWTHLNKPPFDINAWELAKEHEYEAVTPMDNNNRTSPPPPIVKITDTTSCNKSSSSPSPERPQDSCYLRIPNDEELIFTEQTEDSDESDDEDSDDKTTPEISTEDFQQRIEEQFFTNASNPPVFQIPSTSPSKAKPEKKPLRQKIQLKAAEIKEKFKHFKSEKHPKDDEDEESKYEEVEDLQLTPKKPPATPTDFKRKPFRSLLTRSSSNRSSDKPGFFSSISLPRSRSNSVKTAKSEDQKSISSKSSRKSKKLFNFEFSGTYPKLFSKKKTPVVSVSAPPSPVQTREAAIGKKWLQKISDKKENTEGLKIEDKKGQSKSLVYIVSLHEDKIEPLNVIKHYDAEPEERSKYRVIKQTGVKQPIGKEHGEVVQPIGKEHNEVIPPIRKEHSDVIQRVGNENNDVIQPTEMKPPIVHKRIEPTQTEMPSINPPKRTRRSSDQLHSIMKQTPETSSKPSENPNQHFIDYENALLTKATSVNALASLGKFDSPPPVAPTRMRSLQRKVANKNVDKTYNTFPLSKPEKPKRKPGRFKRKCENKENMKIIHSKQLSASFLPLTSNIVSDHLVDYNLRETTSMIHLNVSTTSNQPPVQPCPPRRKRSQSVSNTKYDSKLSVDSHSYTNKANDTEFEEKIEEIVRNSEDTVPPKPIRKRSFASTINSEGSLKVQTIHLTHSDRNSKDSSGYAIIGGPSSNEDKSSSPSDEKKKPRRLSFFFTVPRIRTGFNYLEPLSPSKLRRNIPNPSRPPRRSKVFREPVYTEDTKSDSVKYMDDEVESLDDGKNIRCENILEKIQIRPLPAPPRPLRKARDDEMSKEDEEEDHELDVLKAKKIHVAELEVGTINIQQIKTDQLSTSSIDSDLLHVLKVEGGESSKSGNNEGKNDDEKISYSTVQKKPQDDEAKLAELTRQILQICQSNMGQAIKSLIEQLIPENREKRNEIQAAIWVITIIVAGCLVLGFGTEKAVHHHHWDFHFPPPV